MVRDRERERETSELGQRLPGETDHVMIYKQRLVTRTPEYAMLVHHLSLSLSLRFRYKAHKPPASVSLNQLCNAGLETIEQHTVIYALGL